MSIANVELSNTFEFWRNRTNEAIYRISSITVNDTDVQANQISLVQNTSPNMVTLYNNSGASVANESRIRFNFKDTVGEDEFARISVSPSNITDGSEEGEMYFSVSQAGAITTALTIAANGQLYVPLSLNYENLVIANNVITNKKYVDDSDIVVGDDALAFAIALG